MIPVRIPKVNTSLEFLGIVSRLYLLQNKSNHKPLAIQKIRLFRAFIRDRYRLHFRKDADPEFLRGLAEKAAVPPKLLEGIVQQSQAIEAKDIVSEQQLKAFHHTMDEFYKKCK